MNDLKKIEKSWLKNFQKSPLVSNNEFQSNIAYQLFHGFSNDSQYKARFKLGFVDFNKNLGKVYSTIQLEEVLNYLDFIGITINKENIEKSVLKNEFNWTTFLKKTFYLLKQLSGYDESLDIRNPYFNNLGDLYFFMRIESSSSESINQLSLFEEVQLPDFYNKNIDLPNNYDKDKIAVQLFTEIENTDNSYFITGKAGTGKSTFIHYFTKKTNKDTLLFAFTGIAAINIGGQTLHSFFGFPFKPMLPKDPDIKKFNPNFQKYKILQKAKTIIIDEVSMLRSDLLEALDYSLRVNGGNPQKLFGGKQMIFVGDAFQLPPIVDKEDVIQKRVFTEVYKSEYFFDSPSFIDLMPKLFEFKKVHRQTEKTFIEYLNKIRTYQLNDEVLEYFNQKYTPQYISIRNDFVMMLTSNNYIANNENHKRVSQLQYASTFFEAKIFGDFKEDRFPTLRVLELKRDAQVMFVKNDSYDTGRRWVNGTIGKINFIKKDSIEVELANGKTYEVGLETWENRKYEWDKNKGAITSKVVGTFEQFPLKLAWAITIHKSQGLTFEKVNIDLGKGAFVNGQLYTALSRCKNFEGLILKQKITKSDVIIDNRLIEFNQSVMAGVLKVDDSLFNSIEDINVIMNTQKGKIIELNTLQGIIEYDIDKNISFSKVNEVDYKIGDIVEFEIINKQVDNSDKSYQRAVNLKIVGSKKTLENKIVRLNSLSRKYKQSTKNIVDILKLNGFNVIEKPTTKIGEEECLILENYFEQLENSIDIKEEKIEKGSIINTTILDIIYPSLLLVDFFSNKNGILSINNISWNKSRSEKIINKTKKGDQVQVVYLGTDDFSNPIVSQKHLVPRPNETEFWESIEIGKVLKGQISEILINEVIIELENNIYGKLTKPNNFNKNIGDYLDFIATKKNDATLYIELKIQPIQAKSKSEDVLNKIDLKQFEKPRKKESEVSLIKSSSLAFEHDLKSFDSFSKSIYYNFCDEDQEDFFIKSFETNPFLFSTAINIKFTLRIQFGLNLPAWESDFKNKLIPYLNADSKSNFTDQDALNHLSKEKYWFRINRYFDKEGREQIRWALFNEEYLLAGYVDSNTFNFVVLSLAIQRTKKNKSNQKSKFLSEGTFLYDSEILFSSPFQDEVFDSNKEAIFKLLDDKTKAFETIRGLKEESGALLMEEGLSLQIFDRFLEFQENLLKKGNVTNRVWIDNEFKNVTSDLGALSIEFKADLENLTEGDNHTPLVTIRTLKTSTKKSRNEEFVFFSDALLEVTPRVSRVHFKHNEISLDDLKEGFYVEPKISTRLFQVQREVIQDFFAKKIKLKHIESLLLKPEKIEEPVESQLTFFNEILKITEHRSPQNNQVRSVKKSVGNKNIFLIQGPPGTGKTTVIAEIVQQLVNKGEKVLVTSQTHIAVDNVLEKLSKNKELSLLRIGDVNKVKEQLISYQKDKQKEIYANYFTDSIKLNILLVEKFLLASGKLMKDDLVDLVLQHNNYPVEVKEVLIENNFKFIDSLLLLDLDKVIELPKILEDWTNNISNELETLVLPLMYNSIDVVFATCIGVRTDRELSDYNVVFDTVIIDEAGKANLSESIAAIAMAKKVILVGDQKQLPPYIDGSLLDPNEKNSFPNSKFGSKYITEDIQHALKTSFFEFLVNRIESDVFPKSNIEMLNYQHRMHPHIGEFISEAFYNGELRMGAKTSENILPLPSPFDKQVVFIDTSSADNPFETKLEISVRNDAEAQCISQLVVPNLINNGLTSKDFAIVAPYKSQVTNIKKHLSDSAKYNQIEVSTLDSFQGMEFDVIVFSFTRSAYNTKVGFLDDARRLNVAFSRAKKKLILIGNAETLTDKKSHYDHLFDYTSLFKKLVKISKDPKIGNFVNVTDFTDLKSRFQSQIKNIKKGNSYPCKLKLTFENDFYVGHIFFIDGVSLEGMFKDSNKDFVYDTDTEYKMYITGIDYKNERIQLSPKQPVKSTLLSNESLKSTFFKNKRIGDKITVSYKLPIQSGHIFQIEIGFDCFMYDPKKIYNYNINEFYEVSISKLDKKNRKISVINNKKSFKKSNEKDISNYRKKDLLKQSFFKKQTIGNILSGKYINSVSSGHNFKIHDNFQVLIPDPGNKNTSLIKDEVYLLEVVEMNKDKSEAILEIINI